MTNQGYEDDASAEFVMTEYRLALRLGYRRRRVAQVSRTDLNSRLARIGVYLVKRLNRRIPQLAVSKPAWDVDVDPSKITAYAVLLVNYADIGDLIKGDVPRIVVVPDTTVNLTIPRNRAARRHAV